MRPINEAVPDNGVRTHRARAWPERPAPSGQKRES